VKSGLSDALSRFEEDEMIGVVRFTKDDCVRSALCQRTLKAASLLLCSRPGKPGFVFCAFYPLSPGRGAG
jgi:hypothetical protein